MTDTASAAEALRAAAEATTGADTPEAASVVAKPNDWAVRMLALAGPALSAMIGSVIVILGGSGLGLFGWLTIIPPASWPAAVADDRVQALMWIGMALCGILAVVVFRLASGGLKRVEAKAGPAAR